MKPVAATRNLRELWRASSSAARAHGASRMEVARIAQRLRRRNGFDPREALQEGLLDPSLDDGRRYAYIGRAMRRPAQDRLNPVTLEPFTEQKVVFNDYCTALGIPVPRLYGVVGRAGGWNRISGRPIGDREAFAVLVEELPGDVIVKPALGLMGLGIRAFSPAEGRLVDSAGSQVSPASLYDLLLADPEFDLHLVQERLRNHPAVAEITGSPVLQTLRINTIVRPDGSVLVFGAAMKLATGTGDADNYHDGATGNGFCEVSLDDGKLGMLMVPGPEGFGFRAAPTVPGSDRPVAGRRMPFAAAAGELVRRSAPLFLPMRTLGWDVALTADGPVLIEANNWWAPFTPLPPEAWELLMRG